MDCPFCNSEMRNFNTSSISIQVHSNRFSFEAARDIKFKHQEYIPKSFLNDAHYEEKENIIMLEQYICPNCGYLAEFIPKCQLQFILDKVKK